jgi:DNA invertase Pin-like site-specific DNA recombinase
MDTYRRLKAGRSSGAKPRFRPMLGSIRRPEEEEVFGVQDWAEVHRLHREGVAKRVIARRLGMSHTTVHRLLALGAQPRYERRKTSSLVQFSTGVDSPCVPSS